MALETGSYIADLVVTNPTASDPKAQGDDHIRFIKKVLIGCFGGFDGAILVSGTDGGTADAYTVTPASAIVAYASKMVVVFSPISDNLTTTPTINVSSLGVKTLKDVSGNALLAGDLVVNAVYYAVYDGTYFRLCAPTKNYVDQLAFAAATLPAQTVDGVSRFLLSLNGSILWGYPGLKTSTRTSNTILGVTDWHSFVNITSGTFTQTFTSAVTLGTGWFVMYMNSGTGDVTLTPAGAETIDGLTTFIIYPGECRIIKSDGANLSSVIVAPFLKKFQSSGTFIKPPGYSLFSAQLWGAGGSGAKGSSTWCGGGGGGGAMQEFKVVASDLSSSTAVTIGAGGAAIGTANTVGQVGGSSTFGSIATSYGGGGGGQIAGGSGAGGGGGGGIGGAGASGASSTGGAGGASFSAAANTTFSGIAGADGGAASSPASAYFGGGGGASKSASAVLGGGSYYGGGGGGSHNLTAGVSVFGGNGGAGVIAATAGAGTAPGGGGGGTETGTTSGAGADGELRIWGIV